jgi:NADPH-dependent 2,4-dienoyl-CoA reductase/sulfur reductase-like enzyme
MKHRTDVLVVGGGPAGIVSALAAREYYPGRRISLMKHVKEGVIPCGIPYMFASLGSPDENALKDAALMDNSIEIVVDEVVQIKRQSKTVLTKTDQEYAYEKLILAVGSLPATPPIPGIDKDGVYPIYKSMGYLRDSIREIKASRNVLIIGGGFIGVELADEVAKMGGANVSLVEIMPSLLAHSFDAEFAAIAEEALTSEGVTLFKDTRVDEVLGAGRAEGVRLSDGREMPVDCIILGVGGIPNTKLAIDAGLDLGRGKGIWVDEYMRTSDPDIFAVGDCAGKRDFYTRKDKPVMLASTATAEARIAGANLYAVKVVRENKGTIAIYSTYVNGRVLGSAGLTEGSARDEGFEVVIGRSNGVDKHPATLPGASTVKAKLVFSKHSGIILGGQVAGGISCGEMINLIGLAVQKRLSFTELETLQLATHPCLTSAPTVYPLVKAAENASGSM